MSEMSHTSGKLHVEAGNDICARVDGTTEVYVVAECFDYASLGIVNRAANARRLCAAWNICEGISTETLESGIGVKELLRCSSEDGIAKEMFTSKSEMHRLAVQSPRIMMVKCTALLADRNRLQAEVAEYRAALQGMVDSYEHEASMDNPALLTARALLEARK